MRVQGARLGQVVEALHRACQRNKKSPGSLVDVKSLSLNLELGRKLSAQLIHYCVITMTLENFPRLQKNELKL